MIDLHFGWSTNGNEMHIWPADGSAKQMWKFELLSTETGETHSLALQEESARLRRELHEKYDMLFHKEQELTAREAELDKQQQGIAEKEEKFMQMKGEMASKEAIISKQENSIRQLQKDLEAMKEELAQARKAKEGASQHTDFRGELSQQQTETATLQVRMDRFEYLMSKVEV
ncbi:Ricin-type beta-trefoil lectin domain containing protein [Ceratobasidium theobromae]|uniref:Ricin-type beta-trefoil lectin domain containing protein n=1 Tax=Ceratobasidium theobromae TaxID=1582974 RepID=A0A5N5QSV1_9AGAM|nr:Ricin-type beta-trefoil lectin domain containing protein [Ceratobasidium theobromae]